MSKTATKNLTMDELLAASDIAQIKAGDVVEGIVSSVKKHEVWVDLGPSGVGVIFRREVGGTPLVEGETISASIVDPELDEGYALLSMKRASKDRGWSELAHLFEAQEIVEVVPYSANRGGLLVELEGIRGFMPVSQLSAENYPRVSDADKDEILTKLNSLVGKTLRVRILDVSRKDNKLIFSEKEAVRDDMQSRLANLKVDDVVEGVVTGVIDFGAFVNVDGIAISNAATIDGDIIVGIYGPVITEETATDLPLIVESAVTAHSGANTSQTITFTSTSLNKGRYYAAIQFSSATATYNRTGNVRQVAGWTHLYDRVGGFGALTDPCPTQTESVSAMPGINIRVEV